MPASVKALLRTVGRIAATHEMQAYAVGGCVRDWLLDITRATDLDIAVEGEGISLARLVATSLEGIVEVHEQFGTATVRRQRRHIDFATCRRETYARPAAYPRVWRGTLAQDLQRRDFTINAIAMSLSDASFGRLIDPFGGAADLQRKQLRALHARSFLDDPSRILRGIRFAERFGLRWDPCTLRAAREAVRAGALGWLNAGRFHKEFSRMLEEPHPGACLDHLAQLCTLDARSG